MRAGQVWRWIHRHGVTDFAAMTNIAKETRRSWRTFTLERPEIARRQESVDGSSSG
jgi:23S rRNA (adenine2503-C2)-methyltransferase